MWYNYKNFFYTFKMGLSNGPSLEYKVDAKLAGYLWDTDLKIENVPDNLKMKEEEAVMGEITDNLRDLAKNELSPDKMEHLSVEELNAYEEARWQYLAKENGVEISIDAKTGRGKSIAIKDEISYLGTKEYKILKKKGLQKGHNELRDFLRKENGNNIKILQVEELSTEEKNNGLTNAIKAIVVKGEEQETILFGKNEKNEFKILSLSNQQVKGSETYSSTFLTKKAHKLASEIKDWQVNQDIIFDENGKGTSANIKKGEGSIYIDNSGKVVKKGWVAKDIETTKQSYTEQYAEELNTISGNKNYFSDYKRGIENAKETEKNVIVIAVSETCDYCNNFVENILKNHEFRSVDDNTVVIFQDSENVHDDITKIAGRPTGTPQSYFISNNSGEMNVYKETMHVPRNVDKYKDEITNIFNSSM